MTKTTQSAPLSKVQRDVLAAALLRADGAVALGERVKGHAAAAKVGQALLGKALVREIRAKADLPVWRRDAESGRAFSLVLTKAGRICVARSAEAPPTASAGVERAAINPGAAAHARAPAPTAEIALAPEASPPNPRLGSKLADVIALLRREGGISVAELMAATGWLPHTTRAALTGLRKRGYAVMREVSATGSIYRITGAATATA